MVTWLGRWSPVDSSPVPRRADVLETGDFGGDKLSGLPRHVERLLAGLPDVLLPVRSVKC